MKNGRLYYKKRRMKNLLPHIVEANSSFFISHSSFTNDSTSGFP